MDLPATDLPCTCKRTPLVIIIAGCPHHDVCMCHEITEYSKHRQCLRCETIERLHLHLQKTIH